jgi:hypothetical protein
VEVVLVVVVLYKEVFRPVFLQTTQKSFPFSSGPNLFLFFKKPET